MSTMTDQNKNQFQNKGKSWGSILETKQMRWLMRDTDAFTRAVRLYPGPRLVLLHRIHARSAFWGGLRIYIIGSFVGEKRPGLILWTYRGPRKVWWIWAGGNTKRIASSPLFTMPNIILPSTCMYFVPVRGFNPYNNNKESRFHARLALGSCGSHFARLLGVKRMACIN